MQNFESGGGCLRPSKFGIRSLEVSIREIVAPACPVVGADLRAARLQEAIVLGVSLLIPAGSEIRPTESALD
jgi:hypothetical protein